MINIISGCVFGIFIISYLVYVITQNKIARIIFNFIVSPAFVLTFAIYIQYCFNLPIHLIKNPIYKFILFSLRPFLFIATICIGTDVIKNANSKIDTLINENKKTNQEVIQMKSNKDAKLNEETNRRLKIIEKESEKIKDKEQKRINKENKLKEKIYALEPRIANILLLANKCIEEKIPFPDKNELKELGCDYTSFFMRYNKVGFMSLSNSDKKIEYLCINFKPQKGFWYESFYTNGKELHEALLMKNFQEKKLSNFTLVQEFIDGFEEFEDAFYKWIDSLDDAF